MFKAVVVSLLLCAFVSYMLINNKSMKTYKQFMKRKKKLEESINFFTGTQRYVNQNMIIAVNQEEKKICVSTMKNNIPVPLVYNFDDIKSCEIKEYNVNETTAARTRERVFDVLANSVGKVTDSQAGKTVEENIYRIDLKISFNDPQNPFVLANFLFWEVSKDSDEYTKVSEDASQWYGIIDNIIKSRENYGHGDGFSEAV